MGPDSDKRPIKNIAIGIKVKWDRMDLFFNGLVSKIKLRHIYDGSTTEILIYTYEQYEQYLFNIQYDSSKES